MAGQFLYGLQVHAALPQAGNVLGTEPVDDLGKWYSRDVKGNWHTIKDPFAQARNGKYALLNKPRWQMRKELVS